MKRNYVLAAYALACASNELELSHKPDTNIVLMYTTLAQLAVKGDKIGARELVDKTNYFQTKHTEKYLKAWEDERTN